MKISHKLVAGNMLAMALLFNQSLLNAQTVNSLVSTSADQTDLSLTIYNNNLALIKDTRQIAFNKDFNRLAFEEVSAKIQPETAILRNTGNPDAITTLEQNFDFDLLTPQKLLDRFVGETVTVIQTNPSTGKETEKKARVLSTNGGVVLQIDDQIETGLPGRIVYPRVPENLRSQPTLLIDLMQKKAGKEKVELTYLSKGLHWKADYIATIHNTEKALDLNAWVTLTNQSGASYQNASLQLVAGDVNQVSEQRLAAPRLERTMAMSSAVDAVQQEALFDYQLYSLPRKTDLLNNQTKQVALFSSINIPVTKSYVHEGQTFYYLNQTRELGTKLKASILLTLNNNTASHLGFSLPKGIVRSYKRDQQQNLQFVGEDRINHTAIDEEIQLDLGKAFEISIEKSQTDFKIISRSSNRGMISESEYEIIVSNAKTEDIILTLKEPIPGDWEILSETLKHEKKDASYAQWLLKVPANGKTILKYKVRIQH